MTRIGFLFLLCWASTAADIFSCDGFVKSPVPIDLSRVKIKLLTPEGHLKHEEDVNPQNGYYMIPVYSQGSYVLRVSAPDGWYFEPDSFNVNINGKTDPCSTNTAISFELKEFQIDGIVESGAGTGPKGLPLILRKDGKEIQRTTTSDGGKYKFKAAPGIYEVLTDPSTPACISHGSTKVEVKSDATKVEPALRISGYQLQISASNDGKPLNGVSLTLFTDKSEELPNCFPSKSSKKFECSIGKTNAAGQLVLPCVPIGNYEVKPVYSEGEVKLQFAPESQKFDISQDKVSVSFSVSGFSTKGKVLTASKLPVVGASVLVNGKQKAVTDKDGIYSLESIKSGRYDITAKQQHTAFSTVNSNLSPSSAKIADVLVVGFDVCGKVEKSADGNYEKLVLNSEDGNEAVAISPSSEGLFCKNVAPGKYAISPADSSSSITPRKLGVDLSNGPSVGLQFTHFKTQAQVSVTCIGNCGSITLSLVLNGNVLQKSEGTDVVFADVGPGKYEVHLNDGDRGCWENKVLDLVVDRSKPQPVHFVQNGFVTKIRLSHGAELIWTHADKKQLRGTFAASAGISKICVPAQGHYVININSCLTFDPAILDINVPSDEVVGAKAVDAKITGKVESKEKADFVIKIKSGAGEREVKVVNGVFSFQEPISTSGDIILVPSSQLYLFDPQSYSQRFRGDCIDNVATFTAVKGIFVDGKIVPAVEGVKITATHRQDANVVLNAVSDKNGKFRVGPVRRAEDLEIVASLDGYTFTPRAGELGVLDSVKLSQLSIVLQDIATKSRLQGVLLSVVSDKGYRSNSFADDNGESKFIGLAPGDYFIRPILQEYKFEPSTTNIKVKEGEHEHVDLEGKRVAFSAYGKLREMSNNPVPGVIVEALSEQCDQHQSEATTDKDGRFRILALRPNCQYKISLKSGPNGTPAPHSFPATFDVRMTAEDVWGLEMVAAPQSHVTQLAVEIEFGTLVPPPSYKLSVSRAGQLITQSTISFPVTVFYLNDLQRDGAEYAVRIEPDKGSNIFQAKTVFFNADAPVRVVRIPITASRKVGEVEISFASLMILPLGALIILAIFNQNKAQEIFTMIYSRLTEGNSARNDRNKKRRS